MIEIVTRAVLCIALAILCQSCSFRKEPKQPRSRAETPATDRTQSHAGLETVVSDVRNANLKGRVLHNGKPVDYYGVLITKNFALPSNRPVVTAIQSSRGVFQVPVPTGKWDVSIVGPGFAYKTVLDVEVPEVGIVDLGDIHVLSGFTVKGVVKHDGGVVAAADVRMVRVWEMEGELENLAVGAFRAKTDAKGRFVISGVSSPNLTDIPLRIHARTRDLVSLPLKIENGNLDIEIEVFPSGVIKGTVHRAYGDVLVIVRPVGASKAQTYARPVSGAYVIDLPEGEYELSLFPAAAVQHRITVTRGMTHTADFR